ncbi:MAG: hypothetical protein KFW09_06180 [Oscillospiraceae bacterium]|nr:hypothetical protein [Oscillospiraceae bacterium]
MTNLNFLIIGGDIRLLYLAEILAKKNNTIYIIGHYIDKDIKNIINLNNISEINCDINCIILPVITSLDDETVNILFTPQKVYIDEIIELSNEDTTIFAGNCSYILLEKFKDNDIKFYDYFTDEKLTILNAIATSEGAIKLAIGNTLKTLYKSKILITGFGRISKMLLNNLKGFNADIAIAARSEEQRVWAEANGAKSIHIKNIVKMNILEDVDIIFNTIPSMIFDKNALSLLKKDCLIIDLASKPGGVDFDFAKQINKKVIWAGGLPGKISPLSATEYILEVVEKNLRIGENI